MSVRQGCGEPPTGGTGVPGSGRHSSGADCGVEGVLMRPSSPFRQQVFMTGGDGRSVSLDLEEVCVEIGTYCGLMS